MKSGCCKEICCQRIVSMIYLLQFLWGALTSYHSLHDYSSDINLINLVLKHMSILLGGILAVSLGIFLA